VELTESEVMELQKRANARTGSSRFGAESCPSDPAAADGLTCEIPRQARLQRQLHRSLEESALTADRFGRTPPSFLIHHPLFAVMQGREPYKLGEGPARSGPVRGARRRGSSIPLDGTPNYVHDVRLYCVSIGLQVGGELVVGGVLDAVARRAVLAAKDTGPGWGSRRLQASRPTTSGGGPTGTGPCMATGFRPGSARPGKTLGLVAPIYRCDSAALAASLAAPARRNEHGLAGRRGGLTVRAFDNHSGTWRAPWCWERGRRHASNVDGSAYDPFTPERTEQQRGAGNPGLLGRCGTGP